MYPFDQVYNFSEISSRDLFKWGLFLGLIIALGLWRYNQLTVIGIRPPNDSANYLTTMHKLTGDFTGDGFYRPWLVGVVLLGVDTLLPRVNAIYATMAVSSVLLAIPMVKILSEFLSFEFAALLSVLAVSINVYGSFPLYPFINYFGFTFLLLSLYYIHNLITAGSRKSLVGAVGSFTLLVGFHQTSSAMFVLLAIPYAIFLLRNDIRLILHKKPKLSGIKILLTFVLISVATTAIFLPTYINQIQQMSGGQAAGHGFQSLAQIIHFPFRLTPSVWYTAFVASILGTLYGYEEYPNISVLSILLILASILFPLVNKTFMVRFMWLRFPGLIIGIGFVLYYTFKDISMPERSPVHLIQVVTVIVVVALIASQTGGFMQLAESNGKNGISDSLMETTSKIDEMQNENVVAYHKVTGWTIEGYGATNALEAANREKITWQNQKRDSKIGELTMYRDITIDNEHLVVGFSNDTQYRGNPVISVDKGNFVPISLWNDNLTYVDGTRLHDFNKSLKHSTDSSVTHTYRSNSIKINKKVVVNDSEVVVNISPEKESNIRQKIWYAPSIRKYGVTYNKKTDNRITARSHGNIIKYVVKDGKIEQHESTDQYVTITSTGSTSVEVHISVNSPTADPEESQLYTASNLTQENGVSTLVVNQNLVPRSMIGWIEKTNIWIKVDSQDQYNIYKPNQSGY